MTGSSLVKLASFCVFQSQSGKIGSETLSYGVTFPQSGHEEALHQLDTLLDQYSSFSAPKLLHGDEQKEDFLEKEKLAQEKGSAVPSAEKSDNFGGMVVPPEMVSSDGKKVRKLVQQTWKEDML